MRLQIKNPLMRAKLIVILLILKDYPSRPVIRTALKSLTNRQSLKELEKDIHALLWLLPDYNYILDENRDIKVKDLVVEDLEKIIATTTASNKLYYRVYNSQYNFKYKYASSDSSSLYKEIIALFYSMTNIRKIIEKVKKRTVKLNRFYKSIE
ncbi:hypothetical protein NA56DRAFT_666688 [Hyaloscypha hepaticicola]|uniref:Uncharacterized protein n=1 Tax=Hyaloscypha hepaticicola TaxID=2082293 RepID=A0A2J6PDT1_9HELO|nr:hypothetical protein NA56DRAFT_666688 [Hyaloscypha hepaticicola]